MEQSNKEEEKQEIILANSPGLQVKQTEQKELSKKYFTTKCKWISFSVSFFVLGGIGIFLGIYLSQKSSSAPTLKKFQRDEFQQVDEICMYHTNEGMQNCTEIQMKTKRVVNDVNEKNASSLLMLTSLKVRTFKQNSDGSREYNEMFDQNTEIEQQIQKSLRILQQIKSTEDIDQCEGIPAEECGNINEVPLVTVVTDQQTGAVQQIGIPAEIPDLMLQPLVSNIIHIAPNIAESTNLPGTDGNRLLKEDYTNVYYIGKEAFVPKSSQTKQWFGNTVIKKTISQSDQIDGSSKGINLFDMFEQSQETILDNNNYLTTSHITTNSKFSNTVQTNDVNQNDDDLTDKLETELTNDSNLMTVETKSDEELTNVLSEIQNKQTIQYYSIQDLQDKILSQQDQTQDLVQDQEGHRLLEEEKGDFQSVSQTEYESQQGECNSNIFDQKRTLKEATIFKYKVGLQAEFKGDVKDGSASGYLKSCISLNGNCLLNLFKGNFNYEGKPLETYEKKDSKTKQIFSTTILIMGYPLHIGADLNYSWVLKDIFSKDLLMGLQFRKNQTNNSIIPNKYMIFLDIQIESLTFDLFAQYKGVTLEWRKKCIKIWRKKICWYFLIFDWTDWKDIYRKNFLSIGNLKERKRIFQLISKCY